MKIRIFLYKNNGPGHIAMKAWEPGTTFRHWINFTGDHFGNAEYPPKYKDPKDASLDVDSYFEDVFEFESSRSLYELMVWHLKSKYFGERNFSLFSNNCSHAVRAAMEFLGYDMSAADKVKLARMWYFIWVPTSISTPQAVFRAAQVAVKQGCYTKKTIP